MSTVFIRNKNDRTKLLKYNTAVGPMDEIDRAGSEVLRPKACYIKQENMYLGVIGTESGPALFINQGIYPFADLSWFSKVEKRGSANVFVLCRTGSDDIRIVYVPPSINSLDPWADEESEDFYVWVSSKRNDAEFAEIWTVGD